ncbi:MAG: M42 family metallopeptidase [Eubacteriales bacterium]|nr:M42 family metallopeptidase [Eubacteriales bacterium]
MTNYQILTDFAVEKTCALLTIPSPSGCTERAISWLEEEFTALGCEHWRGVKGGLIVDFGGRDDANALLLESHCDTLGGMVAQIKPNGRLRLTNIGGMNANNAEAENAVLLARNGREYEGTLQLIDASIHVNGDYNDTKRSWDSVEFVLDEDVSSPEDVRALGIGVGDYVCFDPRTRVTASGYIKSRYLDDKLSVGMLLALAKYLRDESITLPRRTYAHITVYEEVGHGGCASVPTGVTEALVVDMGCVGEGLDCTERMVSICAKDSSGPFCREIVLKLIDAAERSGAKYAVDVYPHYSSDVATTLRAGSDVKHGLIGAGVYASHGYERSHRDGVENTLKLLISYLQG